MGCGCSEIATVTSSGCTPCSEECVNMVNTECLIYNGPALPNIGVEENTDVNDLFVAIDERLVSGIIEDKITIASSAIKTMYTTGCVLINGVGSGKYIEILSISVKMEDGTSVYTTAGATLRVYSSSAANYAFTCSDSVLTTTNTNIVTKMVQNTTVFDTIRCNDPLLIKHASANPTAGDGQLSVFITYIIKTA